MGRLTVNLELNSKKCKDGRRSILLRLTKDRKMKRVTTNLYVFKKDFNLKAKFGYWVKKSDPQHVGKNKILKELLFKADQIVHDIKQENLTPTLEKVARRLKEKEEQQITFFEYADKVLNRLREAKQVNTAVKYKSSMNKLRRFWGDNELLFEDIDVSFLKDYQTHLFNIGNKTNTVNKEIKVIRAILYRAIREDLFPQEKNPFFKFKLKTREKSSKEKLTKKEIQRIEQLDLDPNYQIFHARNYFLFSFYCGGIRFTDMCLLKWKNIVKGEHISYQMHKTEKRKSLKLIDRAQQILSYYKDKDKGENDYIFPLLKEDYSGREFALRRAIESRNTRVNEQLKKIAKKAEINKNVSFHVSRHSFADIARKSGASLYAISKALSHSSLSITEDYLASFDDQEVDDTIDKIFG